MRRLRKPLPARRTDTLTRANVQHFLGLWTGEKAPGAWDVCNYLFRGRPIKGRHIERAERLMRPRKPQAPAT